MEMEILMDILSRLPVRSLLRLQCVSIFWKALISLPYFKMKHLRHHQISQKLLITQSCPKDFLYSMYCCPLSSVQLVEDVQQLDFPSSSRPPHCAIRGCCDGMVIIECIYDKSSILLLWNPSTRESTLLPAPEFPLDGPSSCLGIGYDSTSGDYKILTVQQDVCHCKSPSEVLALKSGSWRRIDKHPCDIYNVLNLTHSLAFVHDAFHWIGCFGNYFVLPRHQCVVSFSISDEVYAELPLPEQIMRGRFSIGISILEGRLCVHSDPLSLRNQCYKLWVLKDYGVMESWNPLFTIEDPFIYFVVPKYRFADGEVLFWCCPVQARGNAFRTSSGPFALWPQDGFQDCIAFTESLISPRSLTY